MSSSTFDPFDCPSPIEEGINEGYKDGLMAGRQEGLKEGFREGLKSGKDFGVRLAGSSLLPLLQIIQTDQTTCFDSSLVISAHKLLSSLSTISLSNDADPEKTLRCVQLEAKIKALTVNFGKKMKDAAVAVNRINKSKSNKDELSF